MTALLVAIIIAIVLLSVALWAIEELAPPELRRPLRVVVVAIFVIWLIVRLLPMLGVS